MKINETHIFSPFCPTHKLQQFPFRMTDMYEVVRPPPAILICTVLVLQYMIYYYSSRVSQADN
jgi:hypothetical protein